VTRVIRLVCLIAIALGSLSVFFESSPMPVVPFPGSGRSVRFASEVSEGDYVLLVTTPTPNAALGLSEQRLSCEVDITIMPEGKTSERQRVQTLSRVGQIGWMHLDELTSDASWHLGRGHISLEATGSSNCETITSQGGTLSLERTGGHPTERYLLGLLRYWGSRALVAFSVLVLAFMEIRWTRPEQLQS
jgi:hypothetical protein